MTGYDEAADWLKANAPGWLIERAEQTLSPGYIVGAPTSALYNVALIRNRGLVNEVFLTGEGASLVEAVKLAVGGLKG